MKFLTVILAAAAGVDPLAPEAGFFNWSTTEGKIVLGAIALAILGLGIWAVYAFAAPKEGRRHRRRHRHHREHESSHGESHHDPDDNGPEADTEEDSSSPGEGESHSHGHRHRRRRRRREHRPRNPTLAETGGLPPIRTDAPPGP